jgi:hypothetical protein
MGPQGGITPVDGIQGARCDRLRHQERINPAERLGQNGLKVGIGGGDDPPGLVQADDDGKGLPGVGQHGQPGVRIEIAGGTVARHEVPERLGTTGGG